MIDNVFYASAVNQLTERNLTVVELIQAVEKLKESGRADLGVDLYRRWIERNPADPVLFAVQFNYSVLLTACGDLNGAREALERALALKPDFYAAGINLGGVFDKLGQTDKAIAQWLNVVNQLALVTATTISHKIAALTQVGRVLQANYRAPGAEAALRQVLELDPTQRIVIEQFIGLRLQQCEWPTVGAAGIAREPLMRKFGTLSTTIYTDDPLLQLASAWSYYKDAVKHFPPCPEVKPRAASVDRLRIGYLSSDLHGHAIGMLMTEVFELHDRRKVEVFAYYCGTLGEDQIKTRIRGAVEHWVDISGMDDVTATSRIAADGIDILVDVNGYTRDARVEVISRRPAPIIVNWLGYPGTIGSPYHHYIIADDWIVPKGHEIYFSEKVVRLPCYQPNDRKRVISPNRPTRREAGLPDNAMVYCCFNGAQKISRFTFDRWMTILSRVPGSVLWLLDGGESSRAQLVAYAAQRGIAPERIIFAPKMSHANHLARYPLGDLFLDTAPYGAHTTASDSLWMGVPILTLSGHSFASRVCGSLARSAGLPDLVCRTPEEYVERAVALGQNRADLERYRKRLAAGRDSCTLFDMNLLVRKLEGLYREMWKEFHAGQRPRPDLANLDVYHEVGLETDHDTVEVLAIKDYQGWYREKLTRRHQCYAIPEDRRLWTAADIARAEAGEAPPPGKKPAAPKSRPKAPAPKKKRAR